MEFLFNVPSTVKFGAGCINQLPEQLDWQDSKKVLCITDQGVRSAGIFDKIVSLAEKANVKVIEFDNVLPDPPYTLVEKIAGMAKDNNVDTIIGVGGGSTMDTAKCVNILLTNSGSILDYSLAADLVKNKGKFLILIPTTFGTASEVTDGGVISVPEEKKKVCIWGKNCGGDLALIDPELSISIPPHITASTGLDALSHAVESYTSNWATPLTETVALEAVKLIVNALPKVVKDGSDLEARTNMCLGSLMAGIAFNNSLLNQGHGIAHPMGAHWHIPHGIACAWALPFALEDNASVLPEKTKKIGRLLGAYIPEDTPNDEIGAKASKKVFELLKRIDIPNLESLGVDKRSFKTVAVALKDEPDQETYPHMPETQAIIMYFERIYRM